jgi:hypothetical protein
LSHGVGAALIAGLSARHILRVGTYSEHPWIAAYWILLTGFALAPLAHVCLLKRLAACLSEIKELPCTRR